MTWDMFGSCAAAAAGSDHAPDSVENVVEMSDHAATIEETT